MGRGRDSGGGGAGRYGTADQGWSPPPPVQGEGDLGSAQLESALLFRELPEEMRAERAERNQQKAKKPIFGLGSDVGEDAEEGHKDARTSSGMRGIEGVEKLKASWKKHPAEFSRRIEKRMARTLDEHPSDLGATPPQLLAVRYESTFMALGTLQAVCRMAYSLAHIHRALARGEHGRRSSSP